MLSTAALFPQMEPAGAAGVPARPPGAVLLVEDEDSLADLLTHLLGRINVRVLRAPDGATARQLFAEHRADITLAFVDCHLPDIAGADLCQELRIACPRLPLLLTSGRDQRALEAVFAPGGPCSFLAKPYMPGDVMRKVAALMGAAA